MIYEGKLYLNLEKQVQKNKEDIEYIINEEGALNQFGLRVVGQVETVSDMPTVTDYKTNNPNWEYGDAFIAGASQEDASIVDVTDATLLVLTRANTVYPNDFWMNLGEFPKPGPQGIQGIQGEQGIQGVKGLDVTSGTGVPTRQAVQGTTYINATTGDVYKYGNGWELIGNIRGVQGAVGATGPQGKQGPIGQTGATGPQGPRGIGVNILGTLTSTSQLPDPTSVAKDSAYIIPVDGVNHLYVIEGTDNLVWTDFGTAGIGEKGDKGDAGIGIDTMTDLDLTYGDTTVTYDTTDGMAINGQARFTYNGGTTKDVTMDVEVPIVAGDGIAIDKKDGAEQVEIKADSDYFDGKYVAKQTASQTGVSFLYGYDSEGARYFQISGGSVTGTVAYRGAGATVKVGPPAENNDAVHLGYANEHYVAKLANPDVRSVSIVDKDASGNWLYQWYRFEDEAVEWTFPRRAAGGVVRVGTPVGVNDATTKAYVDGLHHYTHSIALTGSASSIYITIAAKGYPNPITVIDDAGSTPSLSDLLSYSGQSSKNMATGYLTNDEAKICPVMSLYVSSGQVYVEYLNLSNNIVENNAVANIDEFTITDIVS